MSQFLAFVYGIVLTIGNAGLAQDTAVTDSSGVQEELSPRLVWTELRIVDRRAQIQSLPADPAEYITSNVISSKYYYELTPAHWIAIASDYDDGVAFWSDANHKRIMKGGLHEGATASPVFDGTSSTVDGIAVDWLANNVYWADAAYNWIIVADYDITRFKIVIDDGLDKPRGIAVYPQLGYLFWTDWGTKQTIERATLAGENRTVLVDDNIYFPNGITIDYTTDKIYWTDADPGGSRVEVCSLDGTNRRTVYSHPADKGHFFDVAVFQNYIFVTDWYNGIRCIYKDSGEHYFALNVGGRPFGLTLHGEGILPGDSSPCDAKPCDHLCISDPGGYKCLCQDGFDLQDNHTCFRRATYLAKPQIILAAQNSICYFPSNFPDITIPSDYQRNCILANRSHVVALDVDVRSKTMFFSDFVHKTIQSVRLSDGAVVKPVVGGVGSVEGIAIDWLAQNLYWTDFQLNHIGISRYDGSNRRILLEDDVLSPRSIVIHAGMRIMFWTEFGTANHIERASLDGNNRTIILNSVGGLNGLAIDFEDNRLYYADRGSGSIQHIDFNGLGRTLLYTRTGAEFFDIDIHKDYLLWTEWNTFNGLHAINRENRRVIQSFSIKNESTYGIRIYSDDRQPDYENVCIDNGGCQHLCLPVEAGGMRCECSTGYQLHSDGQTCIADILYDDFLLASDTYLHNIFQINLTDPDFGYAALQLDTRMVDNPVALAYDPMRAQVYWSDVIQKTIRRAFIFNGTQDILFTNQYIETSDGLTIDPTSRLLFWTDVGLPSVQVSHLDGTNRKSIVLTDIEKPRAIVADPGQGLIYWSDWGALPKIERAYMDGTNRSVLVNTGLGWPNGLALDYKENKLYWCDASSHLIEVLDLNTMQRDVLLDLGEGSHPFSIVTHGPYIYWSDWRQKTLMRADKDTGANNGSVGPAAFARLNGLYAYSTRDHAPFSNACVSDLENGGCSTLCLPTPDGRVCACRDGSTLDQDGTSCSGTIQCTHVLNHGVLQSDCHRVPGSTCNVECQSGYQPSVGRIRCGHDGVWNVETDTVCELVKCPQLSTPSHASVVACLGPHVYGNQCRFRCQTGYMQVDGEEEVLCMDDGQWSSNLLTCQVVTCPPLPAHPTGVYSPPECSTTPSHYNTTCNVMCSEGYRLLGVASRMCQADAQWTDSERASTCLDVTAPVFGDSCPSDITVTAESGQIAANVTWPEPQATDNSGEEPTITSSVDSPLLLGEQSRMVMYYARDSEGNAGVCTFIVTVTVRYCDMLGLPFNGYFEHCTHHLGSICAIRCNEGFAVGGSQQRHCELDTNGKPGWSGQPAHCQLIECDEPSTEPNVFKAGCRPPYYFRAACSYSCAPGYERLQGAEYRTCQDDNTWSGLALECKKRTCPPFVLNEHAKISPLACLDGQSFYQDQCTLSCDDGYRLVGNTTHTCLETGLWSDAHDEHFCEDIAAPHFNGTCPETFSVTAPRGETTAVVTWTLPIVIDNEGNELIVNSSRHSGASFHEGMFAVLIQATDQAGNQGTCRFFFVVQVARCLPHSFPHFGDFRGEVCENFFGAQCTFSCLEGYKLTGSSVRTCEWSGQMNESTHWTGEEPVCEVVMCPMFDYPEGTSISGCDAKTTSLPYGSTCYTMCRVGKRPAPGGNNGVRMCQENGTWSGENVICQNVTCNVLPPPRYGLIHCDPDLPQFLTVCRYQCLEGFSLRGSTSTTCLPSGHWSRADPPICQDILAPQFLPECPQIFMTIIPQPCANGSIVSYELPTALDNSGEVNVTGGEDDVAGSWWPVGVYERSFTARDPSGNTAECLLTITILSIECQQIPEIQQASVVSQTCGNQGGSVAEFACEDGTQLIGARYLTCRHDGQWNESLPLCSAVYCSPLSAPPFGTLNPPACTSGAVNYLTRCEIECNAGFGLRRQGSSTCQQNGQWSDDLTESSCMDFTPPVISGCPESQNHILPIGAQTIQVFLATPNATDNSGIDPVIETPSAGDLNLGPGTHFFITTATDESGNVAHCTLQISVRDLEPPTILSCPNITTLRTSALPVYPVWEEPMVNDNIGIKDIYVDRVSGAPVYEWGLFIVQYTFRDRSDNTASCRVEIEIVDETPCQPLQAPPNGALACEGNSYCTVHCNDGYLFLTKPPTTLVCLDSGLWSNTLVEEHISPYLPACTKREQGSRIRWERLDTYLFSLHGISGSCDEQTDDIRAKFVALFSRRVFPLCLMDPDTVCKMENIVVSCGVTTEDSGSRRRRRQTREEELDVNVAISPRLVIEGNSTLDVNSTPLFLNTSARDMFGDETATFNLDRGGQAVFSREQSDTGMIEVFCGDGMVVSGSRCVKCPKGTRYKLSLRKCEPCGIATYQDQEGQLTCKVCQSGRTTIGTGAFDPTHCQKMCPPGHISFWGVDPCQPCPIASYQRRSGQIGCEACPDGMRTRITGATSISLCTSNFQTPAIPEKRDTTTVPQTTPTVVQTTLSGTTGKVDIGVITKNPNDGGKDDNGTQAQSSFPVAMVVAAVVIALAVLVFLVVGVGCVVQRYGS
ncbi:sushi, von Willebrand factor type A, EGF and pentraxin domain-containing protein 1-like [Asterias rubens]|uniref:sushi, von Willebrand factor type A, EGF and pentraxin domain-containing protein 1-like n=1 Tax=Asterias rubens TaxID=7604 RepID=UPI001455D214|nr:sushi, von Willebrand factor type A, EGF and pentraxin domain-containing protein 1-like [Asterias rubens]